MNENVINYEQSLQAELTALRNDFLGELKSSPNEFTHNLANTLEVNPPNKWLDIVVEKINPEQFPQYDRLMKVEAALCQMEIGQFGYCCDCEQAIEPELLEQDPATQRCISCKAKAARSVDMQQK
ncbi:MULTISPECIES: TraR/DksA C4-type zinc finger protein [unclassified Pseudoalteromonas]|uniref:TraR/DksA family transcriptional regulator n=1 Tax=unclassified Pseudoalteromonas TaxID=194690 RepID=UPI000F653503|nr:MULTISPECIES: TraR/DksA C4-type zinc finger protein [unclassified Pseudoalteromonas]RRS08548.1 conjugal transfer protein TraR [Pseudoalteromonas sp. J010]RXF04851.1 conjugal transfer protein TraR [Pseudoalteromonas sp. PS5]USD27292.1 conjugal transfer protein TraR [Pseudoalteromonas sp. SCSIO 43201]